MFSQSMFPFGYLLIRPFFRPSLYDQDLFLGKKKQTLL